MKTYVCYMNGNKVIGVEETGAERSLDALTFPATASLFYFFDAPAVNDVPHGDVLGAETNISGDYMIAQKIISADEWREILRARAVSDLEKIPRRDTKGQLVLSWVAEMISIVHLRYPWHAVARDGSVHRIIDWTKITDTSTGKPVNKPATTVIDANKNIMMVVPGDTQPRQRCAAKKKTARAPKPR